MIFNKYVIIGCKTMNGSEIFVSLWNIKHIVKDEITGRGTNSTMTNLTDSHTCTAGGVDLVVAGVLVSRGEFFQLPGDMISSTSVSVPIRIYPVVGRRCLTLLLLLAGKGCVETLEAAYHRVALNAAKLADWTISFVLAATSIVAAVVVVAATICAPRMADRTCAFQSGALFLASFSVIGQPIRK
jgi:hypothetical protein